MSSSIINERAQTVQQVRHEIKVLYKNLKKKPGDINASQLRNLLEKLKNWDHELRKPKKEGCCYKVLRFNFRWGGFAAGVIGGVSAVYTLIVNNQTTCALETGPLTVTAIAIVVGVAISGGSIIFSNSEEKKNLISKIQEEKEQKKREIAQASRDEQTFRILRRILKAVDGYKEKKDHESFKRCVSRIGEFPQDTPKNRLIRDRWLTNLIAMSQNEDKLQGKLSSIQKIVAQSTKYSEKAPFENLSRSIEIKKRKISPRNASDTGEGTSGSQKTLPTHFWVHPEKLQDYKNKWTEMETSVGYPINFLEKGDKRFDREGNIWCYSKKGCTDVRESGFTTDDSSVDTTIIKEDHIINMDSV